MAAAGGDIIVMLDGDGSAKGEEIPRFVRALRDGADLAKGSRFTGDGGSADITRLRRFGNGVFRVVVNRLFGTRYTDLCYGYNAAWATSLRCSSSARGSSSRRCSTSEPRARASGYMRYRASRNRGSTG